MKKGFTLIELLISMTVLSILLLTFSAIFGNSVKTMREQLAQTQAHTDAQTILDRIESDVRKGRTTENSYNSYTLGAQTLIIQIPSVNSSQNIIYSGQNALLDRIVYFKSGSELKRVVFANPASVRMNENNTIKTLSKNITDLNFVYSKINLTSPYNADVETNITISRKVGKILKTSTVKSKTTFRNLP